MQHAEHTVTVDAPQQLVWEILTDVVGYAKLFPFTQHVEIVEEGPSHELARLTVEVNKGVVHTWVSRRDFDRENHVIAYRQIETAPLVKYMGGEWRALALGANRTQLVLTHDFEPKDPVDGLVAGKFTPDEAQAALEHAVERNGVADLECVKAEAERRLAGVSS